MNAHDDDRLRTLFDDAVSDVEPRGGLDRIQARTATRTRRPWVWGAGGAVLATAATVAAVAMLTSGPGTTDAGPGPAPATQPSKPAQTSATEPPGGTPVTVSVYYAGRHDPRDRGCSRRPTRSPWTTRRSRPRGSRSRAPRPTRTTAPCGRRARR